MFTGRIIAPNFVCDSLMMYQSILEGEPRKIFKRARKMAAICNRIGFCAFIDIVYIKIKDEYMSFV